MPHLFGGIQIQVEVPENRYFGGNICMGDLLVVQDFIESIREHLRKNSPPDLVVIPSSPFSLGQWRRDLEGRAFTEIERSLGLPVALLDCEPIYDWFPAAFQSLHAGFPPVIVIVSS